MTPRIIQSSLALLMVAAAPLSAAAEQMTFRLLGNYSRVTFKSDAPLETIVGTTAGPGITATLSGDPAKPAEATGTVKVDLNTVKSGVEPRDRDMVGKNYRDTANEANRYALFELKGLEIAGPLQPGVEMPGKLKGILTVKQKPVEITADARITYVKLTPEQVEAQKRFGFTSDNIRLRATFGTTFANHGMQVPQLLIFKLSNDIQLEADFTFARQ